MARPGWMTVLALAFALVAAPVFGQGGTNSATLNGVVQDKDGNVPGATVVVTNVATGEKLPPRGDERRWRVLVPGIGARHVQGDDHDDRLQDGRVSMSGCSLVSTQQLSRPSSKSARREEDRHVRGVSDIVRTDTPTVSQTIGADFIQKLPRADRNALNFLIFLPGVQTVGGAGSARSSTIAGLPQNTINITIDGIIEQQPADVG